MSKSIKTLVAVLALVCGFSAFAQPGPVPSSGSVSIGVSGLTNSPNYLTNWALINTNAFLAPSVVTNAATKAAQDATNGLGTAAFTASSAYQIALGFTPLTPAVVTNAAVKAAQDATNGLGENAFTAKSFTTNVAVKAAQDATNGLSSGAASQVYSNQTVTIAGTANQVTSSAGAQDLTASRTWTLSLPQNIHTAATPQFARIGLGVAADATVGEMINQAIATSTAAAGLVLSNTTVATVGAQAFSPFLELDGNGWKTTSTAGSQPIGVRLGAVPVQSATSPSTLFRIMTSTNNSSYKTVAEFSADAGQTNQGQFLNIGQGLLLTGPAGTSSSIISAGTTQMRVQASTTVSLGFAGVDVIDLNSGYFGPTSSDGTYTLGDSSRRWRQIWHLNNKNLTTDQTSTSASLASTTLATASLPGTWRYHFTMVLYVTNTVAADGVSIDFNGGTASMTQFRADVQIYDSTGLIKVQQTSALATAVSASTLTGDGAVKADISFVVNSGGTFIPRFAVASHSTGTLTVRKDSCLIITDLVP